MSRRSQRFRSGAALLSTLMVSALTISCGNESASVSHPRPTSVRNEVTSSQAQSTIAAYDDENNRVNRDLDLDGVAGIETAPLRTSSEAWMKVSRQLKSKVPAIRSTRPTFITPTVTSGQRWFLAICQRVRGGVPSPQPTFSIFVENANHSSFLAAYSLTPVTHEEMPSFAQGADGHALAVTAGAGLAIAPSVLNRVITDHYAKHRKGEDGLAFSESLDNQLGAGFRLGVEGLGKQGVQLSRTLDEKSRFPRYAVRTSDGGALVFSSAIVKDSLRSTTGSGVVKLRRGGNDAALLGRPEGASSHAFHIERLQLFMTYVPSAKSGKKAKLLAFSETAISVTPEQS
ncbi:hypothetical protein [Streptomyces sp. NPDC095817]|uniref:hypothetical protein n=1 Tax=Streptomyces sp. NPDC095817 TaxID=3155082 RepID=UPI003324D3F9